MSTELDEEGFRDKLSRVAKRTVGDAANRVKYAFGSKEALGSLNLSRATKQVYHDWAEFSQREYETGDKAIKDHPNLRNLAEFLQSAYGLNIPVKALVGIARAAPAEETPAAPASAPGKGAPRSADDHARDALSKLKSTSPEEYDALKKKFTKKPQAAPAQAAQQPRQIPKPGTQPTLDAILKGKKTESVHLGEDDDDDDEEDKKAAAQTAALEAATFDPNKLFPKLANFLIKRGVFQISRPGEKTVGTNAVGLDGGGVGVKKDANGKPESTTSARVTDDGHSIDINKMKEYLEANQINGASMGKLKSLLAGGAAEYPKVMADDDAKKTMVAVVFALLKSISDKNDEDNIEAQHSITPEGNVIDINIFKKALKDEGVKGSQLAQARKSIKSNGGKVVGFDSVMANPDSEEAKAIYSIATAALKATKKAA